MILEGVETQGSHSTTMHPAGPLFHLGFHMAARKKLAKVSNDDIILNYNQMKSEALQSFTMMDDMLKRKEDTRWLRAVNVSTPPTKKRDKS